MSLSLTVVKLKGSFKSIRVGLCRLEVDGDGAVVDQEWLLSVFRGSVVGPGSRRTNFVQFRILTPAATSPHRASIHFRSELTNVLFFNNGRL